jgi:hypothetical protein
MSDRWQYEKPTPTPGKVCKHAGDDRAHAKRPAPYPGPRCATCHRAEKGARRQRAHGTAIVRRFGITEYDYQLLYRHQRGRCFICQQATGRSKHLAVDHDHRCDQGHDPKVGCPACVRGLLCSDCNRMLGRFKDDPAAFERAAAYLRTPPARGILSGTYTDRPASSP